jgi:hypothetical protein
MGPLSKDGGRGFWPQFLWREGGLTRKGVGRWFPGERSQGEP